MNCLSEAFGEKDGTFLAREIESTQMGPDPIELLDRVTGRPPELIISDGRTVELRKLWFSMSVKLRKDPRLIGSCMNTGFRILQKRTIALDWMTGCFAGSTRRIQVQRR